MKPPLEGEARAQNVQDALEAERDRQRNINERLRRIRQLGAELKYAEALQVIDENLFLDPRNPICPCPPTGLPVSQVLQDFASIQHRKEKGYTLLEIENQDRLIPPTRNLRGPGNRAVTEVLTTPKIGPNSASCVPTIPASRIPPGPGHHPAHQRNHHPLNFENNTLEQVVGFLEQVTGLPIYVDWRALETIGVSQDSEVSLELGDVPVSVAMERILEQVGDGSAMLIFPLHHSGWNPDRLQ